MYYFYVHKPPNPVAAFLTNKCTAENMKIHTVVSFPMEVVRMYLDLHMYARDLTLLALKTTQRIIYESEGIGMGDAI